jgi:hypothetical protein
MNLPWYCAGIVPLRKLDYTLSKDGQFRSSQMPKNPAMRRGGSHALFQGGHLLSYGLIALALTACAMPSLESGSNLLTVPPHSTERAGQTATPGSAMALQSVDPAENSNPVLLGAVSHDSPQVEGATVPSEKILQPMPADGIMRGEFWGSSVAFADRDGLVCAGRLVGRAAELVSGLSVPVNCSDGSAGRVKVVSWASPDEAEGVFFFGASGTSPVRLIRSASLQ